MSNGAWFEQNETITAGVGPAPDGTNTATQFVALNNDPGTGQVPTTGNISGRTFTASIWVKAFAGAIGEKGHIFLFPSDWSEIVGCDFPLTGGWTRVSCTMPFGSGFSATGLYVRFDLPDSNPVPGDTVWGWGPQLEEAVAPGPYVATGSSPASGTDGIATLTTIALFPGDHSITAYYSGDSNYSNATSNAITQTIIPTVNPPIYSYVITPTGGPSGYSPNGNVTAYTDSVMGTWSLGYDALNRLTSANASPAVEGNSSYQWFYDSFGNRLTETGNMGTNIWTQSGNDSNGVPHNQVAPTTPGWPATNARGVAWTPQYDAAGD